MLLDDRASKIVEEVLAEKIRLESDGKTPKILLLSEEFHDIIEQEWLESIKELPWGEELFQEMNERRGRSPVVGEGALLGLLVIRVDTIEGFEVR